MRILTVDGYDILRLSDGAHCKISGERPEIMFECPIHQFDDFGVYCVPDLCDKYSDEVSE